MLKLGLFFKIIHNKLTIYITTWPDNSEKNELKDFNGHECRV